MQRDFEIKPKITAIVFALTIIVIIFSTYGCRSSILNVSENTITSSGSDTPAPDETDHTIYISAPIEENPSEPDPTDDSAEVPDDSEFVAVNEYIPTIFVDLKYSTDDNFTGEVIYDFSEAYLRYGTVKKLMIVQDKLIELGYSLKIWDAFRPIEAQFALWEVCPDPKYVANPNTGYSSHSRGNTVDITLVTIDGVKLEMPTEFDDFSALADRDYSDVSSAASEYAKLLEEMMIQNGFDAYPDEWWHFSDTVSYPVEDRFTP